jgi:hypothetical protein
MALIFHGEGSKSLELDFLERLRFVVRSVPKGSLTLHTDPKADYVGFKIVPSNPKSAGVAGEASTQGGIAFNVGAATTVELSKAKLDFFFEICVALFTRGAHEQTIYAPTGRVLYSVMLVEIGARKVRLGGHQLFWWLFPRRVTKSVVYDPYYRRSGLDEGVGS